MPELTGQGSACPRIFVVSHIRLVRDALSQILRSETELTIVGTAEPSTGVIDEVLAAHSDVVLIDMSTPDNLAVARALSAAASCIRVVGFAVTEMDQDVLACAQSGMVGYVSRDGTMGDLVAAVGNAVRGELHCSPRIAAMLFSRAAEPDAPPAAAALTPREGEIARLIDDGLSNKAIARALAIGPATVKNHVHNLLEKLGVHRRSEAAARLRQGRTLTRRSERAAAD
jgi:DNA-binding NarL/FixJ family response regulator